MRQYAWYSPAKNIILLQSIMEECKISFEWGHEDMGKHLQEYGYEVDPLEGILLVPLGEL